jgi:hypothetical protein
MARPSLRYNTGSGIARPQLVVAGETFVDGPTDTGHLNAPGYPGSLTNGSAITVGSNQTYNFYRGLSDGELGQPGTPIGNVTFYGCAFESSANFAAVALRATGPITFRYCTFKPSSKADSAFASPVSQTAGYQFGLTADGTFASPGTWNSFADSTLTVDRCHFWGFANATKIFGGNATTKKRTFTRNWITNPRTNDDGTDHTDGLGAPGGGTESGTEIRYNRIEAAGDTNGIVYQFEHSPAVASWSNFTITNNLIGGWGYAVAIMGGNEVSGSTGATGITFTDNVFSTLYDLQYAPCYDMGFSATSDGNTWRRNTWLVPPGAFWGTSGNSGKFWIPNATPRNRGTGDDSPYVSTSDYTG